MELGADTLATLIDPLYEIRTGVYDGLVMFLSPGVANASMTLSKYIPKYLRRERHTIDSAIKGLVKRVAGKDIEGPIFGSHKTLEGLGIGIVASYLSGYLASNLPLLSNYFKSDYPYYAVVASVLVELGDLLGSFIKRGMGKKEGEDVPWLDATTWMLLYPRLYYSLKNGLESGLIAVGRGVTPGRVAIGVALNCVVGYAAHRILNRPINRKPKKSEEEG